MYFAPMRPWQSFGCILLFYYYRGRRIKARYSIYHSFSICFLKLPLFKVRESHIPHLPLPNTSCQGNGRASSVLVGTGLGHWPGRFLEDILESSTFRPGVNSDTPDLFMAPLSLGASLESLFRTFLPLAGAKELWGRCTVVGQVSTSEVSFPWEGLWELSVFLSSSFPLLP